MVIHSLLSHNSNKISLKPIHKNGQQENKFTFDVAKCDKIFDELHKVGCIKMSHLYLL
jgi:hypothetical protein